MVYQKVQEASEHGETIKKYLDRLSLKLAQHKTLVEGATSKMVQRHLLDEMIYFQEMEENRLKNILRSGERKLPPRPVPSTSLHPKAEDGAKCRQCDLSNSSFSVFHFCSSCAEGRHRWSVDGQNIIPEEEIAEHTYCRECVIETHATHRTTSLWHVMCRQYEIADTLLGNTIDADLVKQQALEPKRKELRMELRSKLRDEQNEIAKCNQECTDISVAMLNSDSVVQRQLLGKRKAEVVKKIEERTKRIADAAFDISQSPVKNGAL